MLSGGREYTSFDTKFVPVTAEIGTGGSISGWGRSTPFGSTYIAAHGAGARAGIEVIAPQLIGMDPRHVDRIDQIMDEALVDHNHAKTPIDVACWDLFGKSVGMPVCDLLGGRTQVKMPLISSVNTGPPNEMWERINGLRAKGYTLY